MALNEADESFCSKNRLGIMNAKLVTILLSEVSQQKIESLLKKAQTNEKLRLVERPLKRLSLISSYQTKKTVSVDIPPHIAL